MAGLATLGQQLVPCDTPDRGQGPRTDNNLPLVAGLATLGQQLVPCGTPDRGQGPRTNTSGDRTSYSEQLSGQVDILVGCPVTVQQYTRRGSGAQDRYQRR